MSTAGKIFAGIAIVLAVLVVGVIIAVSTIDVNTLVGPVKDKVKAATGRELTIGGESRLALSLQPKLVLKDVALSNAPWGSAANLMTARQLDVQFALLPLLTGRFEIGEVELAGPVISLETDGKGRKNWASEQPAPPQPSAAANTTMSSLTVGSVLIREGSLVVRDTNGETARIVIDRLSLRTRDPLSPVTAEFRGQVNGVAMNVDATLGSVRDLLQQRGTYPVQAKGDIAGRKTAITAKVRADGNSVAFDDLDLKIGANALTGKITIVAGEPRAKVTFDLAAPVLMVSELPFPAARPGPASAVAAARPSQWLVSDTRVDLAPLRAIDAAGTLAIARMQLANGRQLDELRFSATLEAGRLDVKQFEMALFGSKLAGTVHVDARNAGNEALTVHAGGRGFALAALVAAFDKPREIRGGKTDIDIDLDMRGASPHAWASTASGNVRIVVGPATLANTRLDLSSALDKVAQAVNPFRERDPSTDLVCIVVRLPLANGIAKVDRTIAIETQKVGVSASGTLDFRNETLDFSFHPKVRSGLSIPGLNLADLVGLRGPFASPQVTVNAVGSAKVIASIGAAVGTGGLSALGQALVGQAEAGGPGPCAVALGAQAASTSATAAKAPPPAPADPLNKALGKLFGR